MTTARFVRTEEKYTEEDYNTMLDDCYGDVSIAGYTYPTSYVLKEIDPTAYDCGFSDYQEETDIWACPICGAEYEDEKEAKTCCEEDEGESEE
jgi:hypothetical protein